jgi:hypothetical protein
VEDSEDFFAVQFPPDFPLDDMIQIASDLTADGGVVAGYIPAERGLLDLVVMKYSELMGETTIILPDRNLISRMAAIAEGRARYPLDKTSQLAADLMAYCQCMGVDFDPAIAFHELAHKAGNEEANRELAWFRASDEAQALAWVDISRGRSETLGRLKPASLTDHDLAAPLNRWERNYIVALKIAELELSDRTPLARALALLNWMMADFFLAGPAAIFASMYFSPNAAKKRLIKSLRSRDREKALDGVRNAAWDMTHLSEFARRIKSAGNGLDRFIFATGDRGLSEIAKLIPMDAEPGDLVNELARQMSIWWPDREVATLASRFADAILVSSSRPPSVGPEGVEDPIAAFMEAGKTAVRDWRPAAGAGVPTE